MVKKSILFLCTGNSCRSQIAEAIVNSFHKKEWQAYSAGTNPIGYLHPMALQSLNNIGISHMGHSKHLDLFSEFDFDLVITVCDDAAKDCPVWLQGGELIHMPFPDPAKAIGTNQERQTVFDRVRDELMKSLNEILTGLKNSNNTLSK